MKGVSIQMGTYVNEYKQPDIAVIGISGRFPESDDLSEFWNNLVHSKESIREFPNSRKIELRKIIKNIDKIDFVRSGYLDNIALFEPEYFSISHEECRYIDPQQRLLIELVEEAILNAGYNPMQLSNKNIGLFLAASQNNYTEKFSVDSPMKFLNNTPAISTGRIAYLYNFRGPVLSIDTACSSSLVALHYACQSLKFGETEMAIAGGAEINLLPDEKKDLCNQAVLSPDQKVRAFDKNANGTVAGEGGGIVILKLLNKALDDRDFIHAIIKGSSVNSNGSLANGIAAPSEIGQAEIILRCIHDSKIDPLSISYIEAHGTGTKLGDPIEVAGIERALSRLGYKKHSVPIGSLKTNIGHLNYAAGIASIIKTILSLENKKIPASINFQELNPLIDRENSQIYVNNTLSDWKVDKVRRAGVTSLGMVGTNCHVILEEAPQIQKTHQPISGNILQLSALTKESLQAMMRRLYHYLLDKKDLPFNDVLYTLNTGRRNLKYKFTVIAEHMDELIHKLQESINQSDRNIDSDHPYLIYKEIQKIKFKSVFIFPDINDSILKVTDSLYEAYPQYRDYCDELSSSIENRENLNNPRIQYFIKTYAYSKLAEIYFEKPTAVFGIGIGELIADFVLKRRSLQETFHCIQNYSLEKKVIEKEKLNNTLNNIMKSGVDLFVLFCAEPNLVNLFKKQLLSSDDTNFISLSMEKYDFAFAVTSLMKKGLDVNWHNIYDGQNRSRLSLPGYVFSRNYYFIKPEEMPANYYGENKAIEGANKEYLSDDTPVRDNVEHLFGEVYNDQSYSVEDYTNELSIDSIMIMQFSGKIKKIYGIDVPLSMFFNHLKLGDVFTAVENLIRAQNGNKNLIAQTNENMFPATSAQKNMYVMSKLAADSTSYNLPGALIINGSLDMDRFDNAISVLTQRHESLRTSFEFINNTLIQKIHTNVEITVDHLELGNTDLETMLHSLVRPFDLSRAPLIRVCIIKIHDEKYLCHYDIHHIICDGMSISILIHDLFEIYKGTNLPDLKMQFRDFALWQEELLKNGDIARQEEYWLKTLSGEIPILNLPTDFPRPFVQSFQGQNIGFKLSSQLSIKLDQLRSKAGVSMSMLLLAAYTVLLSKYSGQHDIIVGSPISGRRHEDLTNVTGMFVNTLALRNYPVENKTFSDFLREVRINALTAYENQDYRLETLVEKRGLSGNIDRNPLFNCMFSFQNINIEEIELQNLRVSPYEWNNRVSQFDLNLTASFEKSVLEFDLEYCIKLFKKESINNMIECYINILKEIVKNPDIKLGDIDMLSSKAKEKLIWEFNDTKVEFEKSKTIHMLFEHQALKAPERTALIFEKNSLTYGELNSKANRLANMLRAIGVGRNHIVGLMLNRSFEMIIGIMGILKAGGAYLPIDPEYPVDRIKFMLNDSGADILLTMGNISNHVGFKGRIIDLSEEKLWSDESLVPENINDSDDLAYIIYTSGSTGKPKGVMIQHKAVMNFMTGMTHKIDFSLDKTILALTTISFDIFVLETLLPLAQGMKIVIADENQQIDPILLKEVIIKNKVDMLQATPSRIQMILNNPDGIDCLRSLKDLILGGEAFPKVLFDKLKYLPSTKIYNMYGPTETTVWSSMINLKATDRISIGKPISNTYFYILDKNSRLCPIGIPGEIYISGESLAKGYLNRPELTRERFIPNQFIPGVRMYKTGDFARWLPDGNIEFMGRIDQQLKIRGYRVEPGEIESFLFKYGGIKEAIVTARDDKRGNKQLCCYFTSNAKIDVPDIREYLSKQLPDYMVPSYFIQLEEMPMTPNGKIDRNRLPAPENCVLSPGIYEKPCGDIEEQLALIWQEVLEVKMVGATDNFFELGGHSLKVAILMGKINNQFNVHISLREIFKSPTIRSLAEIIRPGSKPLDLPLERVEKKAFYPIPKPIKAILGRMDAFDTGCCYNKTVPLRIEGPLDVNRLEEAFKRLIKRYEILRTSFENINGEPKQSIHDIENFHIQRIKPALNDIQSMIQGFVKPFDMSNAPLFRAGIAEIGQESYLLIIDLHQSVTDGISGNIFIGELFALYRGIESAQPPLQFKDYSVWMDRLLNEGRLEHQKNYWIKRLNQKIPELNLPLDYQRPPLKNAEGRTIEFEFSEELLNQLKKVSEELGLTLYMTLLACYNVLLFSRTGQADITVGTPVAARLHAGMENIMGMIANTVVMRNYVNGENTFEDFSMHVRENALDAYQNQEYPFDELIEQLNLPDNFSRYSLFDTLFALHNQKPNNFVVENLRLTPVEPQKCYTQYDLAWHLFENPKGLKGELIYCQNLFNKETIKRLIADYIEVIRKVIKNPRINIKDLNC